VGTHVDITKSKQAENKIKESEGKYRKMVENMNSGVAIYQPINDGEDFKIINFNKAAEKITNTSVSNILGKTLLSKFPNMDKSPLFIALQTVNKSGIDLQIPPFFYKDNQREGWRENYIYELPTGEIVAIFEDITKRKNAEINLQNQNDDLSFAIEKAEASEKKFRKSIENAPYPLMIHAEGDVIQLSSAWTKITGYTIKDIPSIVQWTAKAYGEDAIPSKEFIDKLYEIDSVQYDGEWEVTLKNGKKRIWDFSSSPIGTLSDGRKAVISMAADITDRKIIENKIKNQNKELIISKEKAEESDRLKSAFLANMSHEIRTPMNGILGFSELLKNPNLSGDQQQKFVGIIEKSGNRMLNIINDIVDISKIEAGLMKVDIKESNINEQIEYIYTFFKPEVESKGMQLFFKNTLPAKEAIIETDREKLFAILTNLVKNAIKYTKEGSIEFGYVLKTGDEAVTQGQNAELEFYVKDTGIGIPKDRQEAIFERFIQADILDSMAKQGAGLGLSITKAYIEMLGGKIWVESDEGVGSTFYFTLPYTMQLKEGINTKDIDVTENSIKNLKILIAEDDEISEMLLSINVSEFSNEIIKTKTGLEAVEICRNNPDIDLILMDIQMPEMNGYEATRQIRKFNKDVVIIAQTAYGLTGDREKSLDAGCNDYITKPINKPELDSLIQKYFTLR